MEGSRLHPRHEGGRWLFDAGEVERIAQERATNPAPPRTGASADGVLAAEVFALLDQRRPFSAIVRQTRQPPAVIRKIYREWRAGFGEAPELRRDSRAFDEATLEAQRVRDERELRRWEVEMARTLEDPTDADALSDAPIDEAPVDDEDDAHG